MYKPELCAKCKKKKYGVYSFPTLKVTICKHCLLKLLLDFVLMSSDRAAFQRYIQNKTK